MTLPADGISDVPIIIRKKINNSILLLSNDILTNIIDTLSRKQIDNITAAFRFNEQRDIRDN